MEYQKKIKDTEYYYGVPPTHFVGMEYTEALREKVKLASNIRKKLIWEEEDKAKTYDEKAEIQTRVNDISNAIEYNQQLLDEIERYNNRHK